MFSEATCPVDFWDWGVTFSPTCSPRPLRLSYVSNQSAGQTGQFEHAANRTTFIAKWSRLCPTYIESDMLIIFVWSNGLYVFGFCFNLRWWEWRLDRKEWWSFYVGRRAARFLDTPEASLACLPLPKRHCSQSMQLPHLLIVAAMPSYSWSVAWDASPSNAWPDRRARAWALACTNGSYGTFKIPMWISLVHKSILNHLSLEVGRVLRNFKTHVLFTFLAEMMSWNFSPGLMSQREAKNICKIICREQEVILTDFCMKDYASIVH